MSLAERSLKKSLKNQKNEKTEKPVPNLKFAVALVFLGCNPPTLSEILCASL